MNTHRLNTGMRAQAWALLLPVLVALALAFGAAGAHAAAPALKTYASPEEAAKALVQALEAGDRAAIRAALGDATAWIWSGDAAADKAMAARFVSAYETKHAIVRDAEVARLTIGADDFPFAFPLVRDGERWRFDPAAGKEEMLARRIGANELDTIKALQAIVDAQYDYASADRDGDGVFEYAQKFASTKGKRDGLYWPVKPGEPASPLGELVVRAAGEGYSKRAKGPVPFHGYYFRLLKGQGSSAPAGAFDYVVRGNAIGGFAVIAHPAKYGNSGIMSFMVNQEGKVFQADLGPGTAEKVGKIQRFDPGTGWSPATIP